MRRNQRSFTAITLRACKGVLIPWWWTQSNCQNRWWIQLALLHPPPHIMVLTTTSLWFCPENLLSLIGLYNFTCRNCKILFSLWCSLDCMRGTFSETTLTTHIIPLIKKSSIILADKLMWVLLLGKNLFHIPIYLLSHLKQVLPRMVLCLLIAQKLKQKVL